MKNHKGTTLLELLAALSIASILAFISIPSFIDLIQSHRQRSVLQLLYHNFSLTRAEAVARQQVVSAWNIDSNWRGAIEIFTDTNRNGLRDNSEAIIRQFKAPETLRIQGNRWVNTSITYYPDGSAHTASGAFQVGTINVCTPGRQGVSKLVLSIGGRIRHEVDKAANCL